MPSVVESPDDSFHSVVVQAICCTRKINRGPSTTQLSQLARYILTRGGTDVPVGGRQQIAGIADPVTLHKCEGFMDSDRPVLEAGFTQDVKLSRDRQTLTGEATSAKFQYPQGSVTFQKGPVVGAPIGGPADRSDAEPPEGVLCEATQCRGREGSRNRAQNPPINRGIQGLSVPPRPRISLQNERLANTEEEAVKPTFRTWVLKAGARGRGKALRYFGPTPPELCLLEDVGSDTIESPVRCGPPAARQLCTKLDVLVCPLERGDGQCTAKSREGESIHWLRLGERDEGSHHILPDEWLTTLVFSPEGSTADDTGQYLKLPGDDEPTVLMRTAGLRNPVVEVPGQAAGGPTRVDKSSPTSSPNLLGQRNSSLMVSATTILTGRGALLHRRDTNKR
jgi:hypothetical protein